MGALPNRAGNAFELTLFFYPTSIGFLPVLTVFLRLSSSFLSGRTLGEKLAKKENEKKPLIAWLRLYALEISFVLFVFALETVPESINLLGFYGLTIEPVLEARIKMPALFLSIFVAPMTILFLAVFGIRTQKVNSNNKGCVESYPLGTD